MTTDDQTGAGEDLKGFLARVRAGDEDAARELLRRYESKVRLVVRRQLPRLLRSRFDSHDFLQSVWGSFFRRIRKAPSDLENPENLVAFLAQAARNKVVDEYRRASSLRQDVRKEEGVWDRDGKPRELVGAADSPGDVAEAREAYDRLRDLLPEDRHAILELKAQGLSTREIGDRIGVSERTVRRVIETLRRRAGMTDEGGFADGDDR